jgi:hypothetical protein
VDEEEDVLCYPDVDSDSDVDGHNAIWSASDLPIHASQPSDFNLACSDISLSDVPVLPGPARFSEMSGARADNTRPSGPDLEAICRKRKLDDAESDGNGHQRSIRRENPLWASHPAKATQNLGKETTIHCGNEESQGSRDHSPLGARGVDATVHDGCDVSPALRAVPDISPSEVDPSAKGATPRTRTPPDCAMFVGALAKAISDVSAEYERDWAESWEHRESAWRAEWAAREVDWRGSAAALALAHGAEREQWATRAREHEDAAERWADERAILIGQLQASGVSVQTAPQAFRRHHASC